jgi:nitrate/nitrite-specific signal transduction histidine kinase
MAIRNVSLRFQLLITLVLILSLFTLTVFVATQLIFTNDAEMIKIASYMRSRQVIDDEQLGRKPINAKKRRMLYRRAKDTVQSKYGKRS